MQKYADELLALAAECSTHLQSKASSTLDKLQLYQAHCLLRDISHGSDGGLPLDSRTAAGVSASMG